MAARFYKVVMKFPFKSGLPRDVAMNVWHYATPDTDDADHAAIGTAFRAFYVVAAGVDQVQPIGWYMGSYINRPVCSGTLFHATSLGTYPTHITWDYVGEQTFTLPSESSVVSLPLEAAAVVSLRGVTPTAGETLPAVRRRRGRAYIGPLNGSCLSHATNGQPIMTPQFVADLSSATKKLVVAINAAGGDLAVLSDRSRVMSLVGSGHTNDEFDTQRRRGVAETMRDVWSVV